MKRPMSTFGLACLLLLLGGLTASSQTNSNVLTLDSGTRELLLEATKQTWVWPTIAGGVLAGLVGVVLLVIEKVIARREEESFKRNMLMAIRRELEVLGQVFDVGFGKPIKDCGENQPLFARLGLTLNWFTVFEANAAHLGKLDGEVVRLIISIYLGAKKIIEDLRTNNTYLDEYDLINNSIRERPGEQHLKDRLDWIIKRLVEQKKKVEQGAQFAKNQSELLYKMLDNLGIK